VTSTEQNIDVTVRSIARSRRFCRNVKGKPFDKSARFQHFKRKTVYKVILTGIEGIEGVRDGDPITVQAGLWYYHTRAQVSNTVNQGDTFVLYKDVNSGSFYLRPEKEFFDMNRFIRIR